MHLDIRKNGKTQLLSLTGLRGIAALWVVLYHYGIRYFPAIQPGAAAQIIEKGYLAVDLFFLLSGFVLAHVYMDQFAAGRSSAAWPFFRARIARLYPLHIFVLVLLVIDYTIPFFKADIALSSHVRLLGPSSVAALLANLFMLQGLKASALSWNYPTWSISVEFVAYLLFPLAAARLCGIGRASALLWLGLFASWVGFFSCLVNGDFNQWDGWTAFARCIPEFFAGVLLYVLARSLPSISNTGVLASVLGACLAVLLAMDGPDCLIVLLFACIVPLLVLGSGIASNMLNAPATVLIGELSYALYLVHGFVQIVIAQLLASLSISDAELSPTSSLALMLGLTALSLLFAYWVYKFIELPARQYLRKAWERPSLLTAQLFRGATRPRHRPCSRGGNWPRREPPPSGVQINNAD
jgi:peptidoglycan/LPS O-acetylase OafA/YrhL